jgi:hypothetical protein
MAMQMANVVTPDAIRTAPIGISASPLIGRQS